MDAIGAYLGVLLFLGSFFAVLFVLFALPIILIIFTSRAVDYTVDYLRDDLPEKEPTGGETFTAGTFIPLANMALEICPICLEELDQGDHRYCGVCGVGYHVECSEYFGGRCTTMGCSEQ